MKVFFVFILIFIIIIIILRFLIKKSGVISDKTIKGSIVAIGVIYWRLNLILGFCGPLFYCWGTRVLHSILRLLFFLY